MICKLCSFRWNYFQHFNRIITNKNLKTNDCKNLILFTLWIITLHWINFLLWVNKEKIFGIFFFIFVSTSLDIVWQREISQQQWRKFSKNFIFFAVPSEIFYYRLLCNNKENGKFSCFLITIYCRRMICCVWGFLNFDLPWI